MKKTYGGILYQRDFVDNQYQKKPEVLHTFVPNKYCASLLNIEWSNLLFFKIYNTEFDKLSWHLPIKMVER